MVSSKSFNLGSKKMTYDRGRWKESGNVGSRSSEKGAVDLMKKIESRGGKVDWKRAAADYGKKVGRELGKKRSEAKTRVGILEKRQILAKGAKKKQLEKSKKKYNK